MVATGSIIGPVVGLIDRIIPDPATCDAAKLALLALEAGHELDGVRAELEALVVAARPVDRWTRWARPSFLYVMYALLLWAIPIGLIAAVDPATAIAIAAGVRAYLGAIPESLYALFGTGYLGYTAARTWGQVTNRGR